MIVAGYELREFGAEKGEKELIAEVPVVKKFNSFYVWRE